MNRTLLLILLILAICIRVSAQPAETIYQGSVAVEGYVDDGSYGPYNIGFDFTFYGNTYSQFNINSNGQVLFGAGSMESVASSIPTAGGPDNFIAPFWDDLVVDSYGKILYTTVGAAPNRKLIVQFTNMGFYPYPATMGTFSVILYETSNIIQVQFRLIVLSYSAKAHGSTATIGLENSTGTAGLQYAYQNPSAVNSGQAIAFSPVAGPSYSVNSNSVYDGVYLTTNLSLPEPDITDLISPPQDAVLGSSFNFEWAASANAASYTLYVGTDPELSGASSYPAGSNLSYNVTGLTLDATYYWGVFSQNTTGTTWCEIKRFTTSSAPPLAPVPLTIWVEQGRDKIIELQYTGGNASPKAAIITSLPVQGQLYQYNSGSRGSIISTVPTTVTDAGRNVIYAASGSNGNGVGNFRYRLNETGGNSSEGTITVNVSPPGVPNLLYTAKSSGIELQFDIPMADPAGKHNQFAVTVNGSPSIISSAALKTGDPYTIILSLQSPLTGTETVLVSYTQGNVLSVSGGFLFSFTNQAVTFISQSISFPQSLDRKFNESPLTLTASASSGLGLTYSSSNMSVAIPSANILTFLTTGTSDITVRQAGNATYAPARFIKTLTVSKGDQTITFNALPVRTVGDADFNPGATASSGLAISYTSSNPATATIVSGLIHIVGAGSSVITALQPGNEFFNSASPVPQTLTVNNPLPETRTLNLSGILLEGLYNSGGTMRQAWNASGPRWPAGVADHITVELHSSSAYATIVYSVSDVPLGTTGSTTVSIPSAFGGNYYITIKHRNSVATTTSVPVSFAGTTISQSFGSRSNIFGNNLGVSSDGRYLVFAGDVNQDGTVDTQDYVGVDNDSYNYVSGYLATDVDGNGSIDTNDYIFIDNNNYNYIGTIHP